MYIYLHVCMYVEAVV